MDAPLHTHIIVYFTMVLLMCSEPCLYSVYRCSLNYHIWYTNYMMVPNYSTKAASANTDYSDSTGVAISDLACDSFTTEE